ncbi:MAG: PAS domain-containing protein [Cytophagales bacterium]|nr:PAS domain-containing protein [Cytophagales bacterium]MDW8383600.1 PAS domain-containing protein [Flammeovirgaceae bacterium]
MMDLLESERIKKAVDANPEDFERIIEDTKLCVCVTDEHGIYVGMNQNYLDLLGYKREEMIGKSFLMVVLKNTKKICKSFTMISLIVR